METAKKYFQHLKAGQNTQQLTESDKDVYTGVLDPIETEHQGMIQQG